MSDQRFRELDGFRGIAALAVVLSHFTGGFDSRYAGTADHAPTPFEAGWGAYGVQLFFLISGFVILLSARRAKTPSDFVISRVSRLYPAYWIALIVSIVITVQTNMPHTQMRWTDRLLNFTMIQRWILVDNVDNVYWTLAIEMQFYVLIAALLWLTRNRLTDRLVRIIGVSWLLVALAVAIWAFPASHGLDPQNVATPVKLVLNATLAEWGSLFVAGMFAFIARSTSRGWLWVGLAMAVSVTNAYLLETPGTAIAVSIVCAMFLFVAMRRETRVLKWAPIQWYGKISYSLYIGHQITGYALMHVIEPIVGRWLAMGIAFVVVTLIAWGIWKLGEQLGSKSLRSGLLALRARIRGQRVTKAMSVRDDGSIATAAPTDPRE